MRSMVAGGLVAAVALLVFASCAGTTTAVGVTTTQDADAGDKHPH